MTYVTCRLTAKNRDQLRNHTLGTRSLWVRALPKYTVPLAPVSMSPTVSRPCQRLCRVTGYVQQTHRHAAQRTSSVTIGHIFAVTMLSTICLVYIIVQCIVYSAIQPLKTAGVLNKISCQLPMLFLLTTLIPWVQC